MPSSTSQARRCSSLALACLRVRRLVALLSAASCPFPLGVVMSEFVALVFRPLAMFRNRRPAPAVRVLSVLGSRAMVRQLTFAFVVLLFVVVVVVPLGATSPWETVGEQLCELDQLDACFPLSRASVPVHRAPTRRPCFRPFVPGCSPLAWVVLRSRLRTDGSISD